MIAETELNEKVEIEEEIRENISIPAEVQVETINLGTEEEP
jgi:hypothetical protein